MPQTSVREALARELRAIRQEARLTQAGLGELAGLSRGTVKFIESEQQTPKASTLRLLADGAATDGAGRRDVEKAASYYERLMRAAGYLDEQSPAPEPADARRPVEDLTDDEVVDALAARFRDRQIAARFLAVASHWKNMAPSAQRAVLNSLDLADQFDEDIRRAESRTPPRS